MALTDDVYQALIDWLKAAALPPDAPAPGVLRDDQVIRQRQPGPRPSKPYLAVLVQNPGTQHGETEEHQGIDRNGTPGHLVSGEYRGTAQIEAYGDGSYDLIATAIRRLRHPSILLLLEQAGLTVDPVGDPINVGALVDSSWEDRWVQDVQIAYAYTSLAETVIEATTTQTDYTGHGTQAGTPSDLTIQITEP